MKRKLLYLLLLVFMFTGLTTSVQAQEYRFQIPQMTVDVYFNEDGTASLEYVIVFANDLGAHPIEYVDLGIPNAAFNEGSIVAEANGVRLNYISEDEFYGAGSGVAIGMGSQTIPPGSTGAVHVLVPNVGRMLRPDSQDKAYASGVFAPAWFEGTVHGSTDLTVSFHFPPGVKPEEPRWHTDKSGSSSPPMTGLDDQGRITYTWHNPNAVLNQQIDFGASIPNSYIPESAIVKPGFWETIGIDPGDLFGTFMFCGILGFVIMSIVGAFTSSRKRKLQYLPPKVAIEGHGIKRGLTAVEAAILLEEPLDKIMTMILFSVVKKNAAEVLTQDPLKIKAIEPAPEGLNAYETEFIQAFTKTSKSTQRKALQTLMINLVKSVSKKMKGFSRKETVAYYRDIVHRAWKLVEAAETPEVMSEKFADNMEWTMLDREYDERTRRVFQQGPVFVPVWWPRYDPTFRPSAPRTASVPSSSGKGGGVSLPTLPGGSFAASMVQGVQNFSTSVIGNVTEFTSGVTNKTNPVPVSTGKSSGGWSGGGGGGCACACACAGCACACAGGGR